MGELQVFQSEISHGDVVFNFRNNPVDDLAPCAAGYHEAGKRLAERFAASHSYRDFDGYPISPGIPSSFSRYFQVST